ncbi:hypothetical protein XENTR_v10001268 [Xenopus tropicalis]|nr:hypothetical protein XENTR_v10001268 [Xenopus tropicalis]
MWEAVRTGRAVGPAGALEMRDYCDSGRLFHSQCKTCCNSMTLEEITSCDNHKGKDPDRVVLCLLAADPEHEDSIALKIHFTLIKAFCCDNDINIVQVSGLQRLSEITDGHLEGNSEPSDLHCILVLDSMTDSWKCSSWHQISNYCAEYRSRSQWVPFISLTER